MPSPELTKDNLEAHVKELGFSYSEFMHLATTHRTDGKKLYSSNDIADELSKNSTESVTGRTVAKWRKIINKGE